MAVTIAAGLVAVSLPESAVTDVVGDALYVVAAYAGLVVVMPRVSSFVVGAIAAVWSVGVEFFQLTGLPVQWAAEFRPLGLVFGGVFDTRDLAVYVVAASVTTGIDIAGRRVLLRARCSPRSIDS
nr:DUF2809 domain-containing protein [Microbacterium halimionae]